MIGISRSWRCLMSLAGWAYTLIYASRELAHVGLDFNSLFVLIHIHYLGFYNECTKQHQLFIGNKSTIRKY